MKTNDVTGGILPGKIMPIPLSYFDRRPAPEIMDGMVLARHRLVWEPVPYMILDSLFIGRLRPVCTGKMTVQL